MSFLFQIAVGEAPEERQSDLLCPPTVAATSMLQAPHGAPGPERLGRRRLRSNTVAVGVAGLLVLGSYGLAGGQTVLPCDPQYSVCYPDYGYYYGGGHRGWGGREGDHGGWGWRGAGDGHGGWGGYEARVGGSGGFGGFGGFGGSGAGHGGGGGGG